MSFCTWHVYKTPHACVQNATCMCTKRHMHVYKTPQLQNYRKELKKRTKKRTRNKKFLLPNVEEIKKNFFFVKSGKKKGFKMDWETIHGQIVSKANNYEVGNNKHGKRYIIKSERLRDYERNFFKQCKIYKSRMINGRFCLYAKVFECSTRYDLDNALKTLLDCLQMVGAITNDNLCTKIIAEKHHDKNKPRITFALEEYEPRLF